MARKITLILLFAIFAVGLALDVKGKEKEKLDSKLEPLKEDTPRDARHYGWGGYRGGWGWGGGYGGWGYGGYGGWGGYGGYGGWGGYGGYPYYGGYGGWGWGK